MRTGIDMGSIVPPPPPPPPSFGEFSSVLVSSSRFIAEIHESPHLEAEEVDVTEVNSDDVFGKAGEVFDLGD